MKKILVLTITTLFMMTLNIASAFAAVDQQNTGPIESYRYFYNAGGNGYQWAVQTFKPSQTNLTAAEFYVKDAIASDSATTTFVGSVYKKQGNQAIKLTSCQTLPIPDGYTGWINCIMSPALVNLVPNTTYYGLRLEVTQAEDAEYWYWAGHSNGAYTRGYMIWDCMILTSSCISPTNPFGDQDFLFRTIY